MMKRFKNGIAMFLTMAAFVVSLNGCGMAGRSIVYR